MTTNAREEISMSQPTSPLTPERAIQMNYADWKASTTSPLLIRGISR